MQQSRILGESHPAPAPEHAALEQADNSAPEALPQQEVGGREGLEPTRYGDWEKNGRCIDF